MGDIVRIIFALALLLAIPPMKVSAGAKCYGDGVSGKRVHVLVTYDNRSPMTNAQQDKARDLARWYVDWIDTKINDAAQKNGDTRHIRAVHGGNCNPSVSFVALDPSQIYGVGTVQALKNLGGYQSIDRKYLIFEFYNQGCHACTSGMVADDSPGLANLNNFTPAYAKLKYDQWWTNDPGGFNFVAGHELLHAFGAVQSSAPHATGGSHVTDGWDIMGAFPGDNSCPNGGYGTVDCKQDDYFNTRPPTGSYLATHFNVATDSQFLGA